MSMPTVQPTEALARICLTLVCSNTSCGLPYVFRKTRVQRGDVPDNCPTCTSPFLEPRSTTLEDLQ